MVCVVPDVQVCRSFQIDGCCLLHVRTYVMLPMHNSPLTFLLYDDTVCMLFRGFCPNVSMSSLQ